MSANVDTVLSGLDDLPVIARSLISASSPGWCASLSLEPFLGDGESCAGVAIEIDPAGAAVMRVPGTSSSQLSPGDEPWGPDS